MLLLPTIEFVPVRPRPFGRPFAAGLAGEGRARLFAEATVADITGPFDGIAGHASAGVASQRIENHVPDAAVSVRCFKKSRRLDLFMRRYLFFRRVRAEQPVDMLSYRFTHFTPLQNG